MNNSSFISTNKRFILSILFILITLLGISYVMSQSAKPKKKTVYKYPLVRQLCGIRPERVSDQYIMKRFGKGAFVKDMGHGGGRFYTNKEHSYTFYIEIGVDDIIEDVGVSKGVNLPEGLSVKAATTTKLPKIPIAEHGIKLGMTKAQVLKILGPPNPWKENKNKENFLEYHADYQEDKRVSLAYDAFYEFKDDKLISISIHDGE